MSDPPLFSVIIPNWNGVGYLPICLDALRCQTYPHVEVIVVDNASTDGSQAYVADHYPEVRLIALPENRGFTGACNAGIDAAQGAFVALLNNDTEAEPSWAAEVVAAFESHPEAGLIASKMLLFDRRDTLHSAGDFVRTDGRPGNRGVWQPDGPQYNAEEYVFSACGGASSYRQAMLETVGSLDDDFFFSMEDVDLAWRAQLAGWRCLYAPQAVVYHHLAATGGGVTASYHDGRNLIWLIAKNVPGPLLRHYGGQIIRAQLRLAWDALRAWRGEAARARLRGMLAGLWGLPRALRKRRAIQRMRRTEPVETIDWMLTPEPPVPAGAIVILGRADGCVVMQLRDGERHPGHWGLFGGWIEPGESPQEALLREIEEELSVKLDQERLIYLGSRHRADESTQAHVFRYQLGDELERAMLNEGSAFEALSAEQIRERPVVPLHRTILEAYWGGMLLNTFHVSEKVN